jgi:hypothetical protein
MLRRSLWVAPAALALAGPALARSKAKPAPPAAPALSGGPGLIGAWQLVSADTIGTDGAPTPAFGGPASGQLIYDRSGQMSLQIVGDRPGVGTVEAYQALSPGERMVFLDTYYAYFGRFEVDAAARVVIHRVRASLRPNEIGISYRRQFLIDGDRLTLASPPESHAGETFTSRLIFVRVQGPA